MELDDKSKEKLSKQPFIIRQCADYVMGILDKLINGDCDESEITSTMGTLNQNSEGRYSSNDLMNYDDAGKALGFGCTNRMGLKKLLDKHGIKQVIIKNNPVGFRKSEIMALCDKLNDEVRKREDKQRKKRLKEQHERMRKKSLIQSLRR